MLHSLIHSLAARSTSLDSLFGVTGTRGLIRICDGTPSREASNPSGEHPIFRSSRALHVIWLPNYPTTMPIAARIMVSVPVETDLVRARAHK